MKIDSEKIRASVAAYFRYERQYYLVAFEADNADLLVVDKDNFLTEVEVKVSLSDLRRDRSKTKHRWFSCGETTPRLPRRYFYFAVPKEIANKVHLICDEKYLYAGVLGTDGGGGADVVIYRRAQDLKAVALLEKDLYKLVKEQSGTLCRLAMKMNGIHYRSEDDS